MTEFVEEICCWKECRISFGIEAGRHAQLKRNGEQFFCTNGHHQYYPRGKSVEQKLREELEQERQRAQRAEQRVAERDDAVREARDEAEHQKHRANAYKGQVTKIRKRVGAGICPCCNRSFANLARHMAGQHPDFTPEHESESA